MKRIPSSGVELPSHLNASWRRRLQESFLSWFRVHQRKLPWRETRDPYAIWISESMLQQTQVAMVIDYYNRFLLRFPTVKDLAQAAESDVLAAWAGLGYYRRARQLHAAAKAVVETHEGRFPRDVEHLRTLPGIGRYTAGAISSIAFDEMAPILEANTERVYARLLLLDSELKSKAAQELLWSFAEWILPGKPGGGSGALNQASMELGSLICKPRNPDCHLCPLQKLCPTFKAGLTETIPRPKEKKVYTELHHAALLVQNRRRWLLRQNSEGDWWTGLWDLPRFDITELGLISGQISSTRSKDRFVWSEHHLRRVEDYATKELPLSAKVLSHVLQHRHGVTRYRIVLDCFRAELSAKNSLPATSTWKWCDERALLELPLTATAKKILQSSHLTE